MRRRHANVAVMLFAGTIAACGSSSSSSSPGATSAGAAAIGGNVSVWAVWSGAEQAAFTSVLQGFQQKDGVTANYQSKGDQLPTVLGTAIAGGSPPDIAILPQPGLLHDLAVKGSLQPIDSIVGDTITSDFGKTWKTLATYNSKLYGVYSRRPTRARSGTTPRSSNRPASPRRPPPGMTCRWPAPRCSNSAPPPGRCAAVPAGR